MKTVVSNRTGRTFSVPETLEEAAALLAGQAGYHTALSWLEERADTDERAFKLLVRHRLRNIEQLLRRR